MEIWIKVVYKLDQKDWVQNLNFILDRLAFYNLIQNICKIINRFIPKNNRRATTSFLRSEQQIHICKIFTVFFFYQVFFSQTLTIHRTAGEGCGPSFIPLYHFHPLTNIETFICNFAFEMTITYF